MRWRTIGAAAAAGTALVALGVLAVGSASAGVAGHPPDPLRRFEHQTIGWHGCQTGPDDEVGAALAAVNARCGEITVPLDYRHPDRRTITVALARTTATDPAHRHGALFVNPGGPGDPALGIVADVAQGAPDLAAQYDVVGMDPRFVGRSTPLVCSWTTDISLRSAGPTRATFDESVAFARALAAGCLTGHQDVLPYATTRNTARDMDLARAALGESKLSYVGWSAGTYLGAVYLQLFPERADRFVLDSAVDPDVYGPGVLRSTGVPTEAALRNWAGWAAARDATYHLGATPAAVLSIVDSIAEAAVQPFPVGQFQVDSHVLPLLLFIPVRNDGDDSYGSIAADVVVLNQAAHGHRVTPTPTLASNLARVYDRPDPTLQEGVPFLCADRAAPRDPETYYRDIQAHRASEPLFGPLTRGITPCAFWPTDPIEPPTLVRNGSPALIVGADGDPRVPLPGQQAMHRDLTGSRLITLTGAFEHEVFGVEDNDCVNTAVYGYLLNGNLPATDLTCARTA
jgi:pimeloyl-ACP methyl ester carboxylesterase